MVMNKLKETKFGKKVCAAWAGANVAVMTGVLPVLAADDMGQWASAANSVTKLFDTLQAALRHIVTPIAGVALVFCFIMMMVSQNQKKVESYRSWCFTIVFCIVGIYAVAFIIKLAENLGGTFAVT